MQSDFVCRLPLYLQMGMARVRVRKTAVLTLTDAQLALVERSHAVLAHLSASINESDNFGLYFNKEVLSYFSASAGQLASSTFVRPKDPFSELEVNPAASHICAMFTIVRLPGMLKAQSLLLCLLLILLFVVVFFF